MSFDVPEHVRPIRARVRQFIEERVYPVETVLDERGHPEARVVLRRLMDEAKAAGLWALGHPKEIGGQGLPFLDYVYVNEVQGRSEWGQMALGTFTLQDSLMLHKYASPRWRERYLAPLVAGEVSPSFAMTEPGPGTAATNRCARSRISSALVRIMRSAGTRSHSSITRARSVPSSAW